MNTKNKKLIYGVGINDADYATQPKINGKRIVCPYYQVWVNMIKRCYSKKSLGVDASYIGCSVAKEWHSFMTFKRWMEAQNWKDKQLDKDIISAGNKIYSPQACVFVSQQTNSFFSSKTARRGKYPHGIYFHKLKRKFQAKIYKFGKQKSLGYFKTAEKASAAYREAKRLHILTIACCEPDIRVKQGLYRHSELLREKEL